MAAKHFDLRDKVLRNIAARGVCGADWLAELPVLVTRLEREWAIEVEEVFPNATEAFAASAVMADGQEAALKIPIPDLEKGDREMRVLRAVDGRGYVKLLNNDEASGAMLLERLRPQLAQLGLPIERELAIIVTTLQEAWRPPPAELALMTGAAKAEGMASYVTATWSKWDKPCSEKAITVALRFAEARARAFDRGTAVLGHGDAHAWNTLVDPKKGGYKFVDPDGLFIERAHDLSISLREGSAAFSAGDPVALGRERCALLSSLSGVDRDAIWQWGFLESLVNGLQYQEVGAPENARPFLAVADAWAATESD